MRILAVAVSALSLLLAACGGTLMLAIGTVTIMTTSATSTSGPWRAATVPPAEPEPPPK